MPGEQKNVVFRKVRGRIIPIRLDSRKAADAALGGTAVGAGVGVAAYAGKVAHGLQHDSAVLRNLAMAKKAEALSGQMSLFKNASAEKLIKASNKLHSRRNFAILGGAALAAPLIAYGISKFRKPKKDKKQNLAAAFGIASTVAGVEYYRRLINPSLSGIGQTFKQALNLAKNRPTIQYILKGI